MLYFIKIGLLATTWEHSEGFRIYCQAVVQPNLQALLAAAVLTDQPANDEMANVLKIVKNIFF